MKRLLHTPLALLVWRIALLYAALMLCRAAFWVYNAALLGPPEWSELGQLVAGSLKFDTASVGYADGYSRAFSNRARVLLHGKYAPVRGKTCMDFTMVDVTDIPEVQPGDVATIFGRDLSVAEQAEKAGTIPYELLCAMSQRVQRVYID